MVCLPCTNEILVALPQEMAEGALYRIVGAMVCNAFAPLGRQTKKFSAK